MQGKFLAAIGLIALSVCAVHGAFAGDAAAPNDAGFIQMPEAEDGEWELIGGHNDRHWGRPEMIRMIILVSKEWRRRYPGESLMLVGDISKPEGGHFPPHKTHDDGLSVDIFTRGPQICHVDHEDQDRTLELARLFFQFGARKIYYNHPYVIENQPGVQELVKHDDHFHVICDPDQVPEADGAMLVPHTDWSAGSAVGPDHSVEVKKPRGARTLKVAWSLLLVDWNWQKKYRVEVDNDGNPENGLLYDSDWEKDSALEHHTDIVIEHGNTYTWRVLIEGRDGTELALPWQEINVDLDPPHVDAIGPRDREEQNENPLLTWETRGQEQAAWKIQLAKKKDSKRPVFDSGWNAGTDSEFRVQGMLPKGKKLWWRVSVLDGAGNEAQGEWCEFKVGSKYRWLGDPAKVTAKTLNVRKGPTTKTGIADKLGKDDKVYILERDGDWRHIQYEADGKTKSGWVHGNYLSE